MHGSKTDFTGLAVIVPQIRPLFCSAMGDVGFDAITFYLRLEARCSKSRLTEVFGWMRLLPPLC
jgi:hypothetical protein